MAFAKKWVNPTGTPEYYAWRSMRSRCYNSKNASYKHYGGRGISVCERWKDDYDTFLADMGLKPSSKHSLERIDVHGDYGPENCRWATMSEQALNKTSTEQLAVKGKSLTITQWADKLGLPRDTLWRRVYVYKIPLEKALTSDSLLPKMKHGTVTGYAHFKCRCALCTAANTEAARKFRLKRKAKQA